LGQIRDLPEDVAPELSMSHHRRLLAIRDVDAKQAIATKVVNEGLTIVQLEKEVAKQLKKEKPSDKKGRPVIPAYLKSLRGLARLVEPLTIKVITAEDVDEVGIDAMMAILRDLTDQIETLQAAKAEIEAALAALRGR